MVRLGSSEFGIDVMKVREIKATQPVTAVPSMPRAMKGVINLHGKVVPVVDLRVKLGMSETDETAKTSLVVVRTHVEKTFAVVVDEVVEVLRLGEAGGGKAVLDLDDVMGLGDVLGRGDVLGLGDVLGGEDQ
jgi:purine-binding chemotaxis protein CheW